MGKVIELPTLAVTELGAPFPPFASKVMFALCVIYEILQLLSYKLLLSAFEPFKQYMVAFLTPSKDSGYIADTVTTQVTVK